MTTTGELRAIIEELQLVDIGDAASYLGEEAMIGEECRVSVQSGFTPVTDTGATINRGLLVGYPQGLLLP